MTAPDPQTHAFSDVTEMPGEEISEEQLQRICNRYYWAGAYSDGKDVIELACGAGAGLGYLASRARSVRACDIDDAVLAAPRAHYGSRIEILTADAACAPYEDNSADVVILFEAIYYLPDAHKFFEDARRVLRPGGVALVASANKDLFDFNPSPYSHVYYGAVELDALTRECGFEPVEIAGCTAVQSVSWRQRVLRPIKKIVVGLDLMPKTMEGKKMLKRLVFGSMVPAPAEIDANTRPFQRPTPIPFDRANRDYKVILFAVRKPAA
jgi:SAM-dependent methyltransferase